MPLTVGAILFFFMTTWIKGRELVARNWDEQRVSFEELEEKIEASSLCNVAGTAIYLAKSLRGVPQVLLHNLKHNHVLHEQMVGLTIVTKDEPYIDEAHRIKIRVFGENRKMFRVKMYFGFQEEQDVRRALQLCAREGLIIDQKTASFFVGSEKISFRRHSPYPKWRRALFKFLFHNSASAIEYFRIPVDRVVELGIRIEL